MMVQVDFVTVTPGQGGAVAVGVGAERALRPSAMRLDVDLDGALTRALVLPGFSGNVGEVRTMLAPGDGRYALVLLVGIGGGAGAAWREAGAATAAAVDRVGVEAVALALDPPDAAAAAQSAFGFAMRSYRFDRYRTAAAVSAVETAPPAAPRALTVTTAAPEAAWTAFTPLLAVVAGTHFTRDLVSEPANVLSPDAFVVRAREALTPLGVEVESLDEEALRAAGFLALLAVGQGSARPSRALVMRWRGGASAAPVALVGKGVTFDSGGLSLKPAAGMEEMKWDMAGAAVVAGPLQALAMRRARADVVGIVGLVENMPDGAAQRPGDVVVTLSGQTVEVINTDAEGRLVLADLLSYCRQRFQPSAMIDLATLTGAMMVSLGQEYAGFFSNDDALAQRLAAAGDASGDKVWRLPLHTRYDQLLKSKIADMKNVGGRYAGAITAAQFLQRFVGDSPWAHIDIAGMAWIGEASPPLAPEGATGFGVFLLDRLIADLFGEGSEPTA